MNEIPMIPLWRRIAGWLAVMFTTAFACLWGFWGSIEAFHEGWHERELWRNIALTLGQYLLFPLLFLCAGTLSVLRPKAGAFLFLAGSLWAMWFFNGGTRRVAFLFIALPLALLAVAFFVGRTEPRRWALRVVLALPILTILISGAFPGFMAVTRYDDGDYGARIIEGNGLRLLWAPEGPGWPATGIAWDEARRRCAHLSEDGTRLEETPENRWRLPTVDELVRSQCRRGRNAGGDWNLQTRTVRYHTPPGKESPLWNRYSPIIYLWAADVVDAEHAFIVVHNGRVYPRPKSSKYGSLSFRAVRDL